MLKSIEFDVTFTSNGRNIKDSHKFAEGLTSISGANEKGKSMRLEMIRFALWGTQSLRAPVAAYKKLKSKLTFSIGGREYIVDRSLREVTLTRDGDGLATGTKAVNKAIAGVFGYDRQVFDTSNACLQGEINAMSDKTPAERKKMIDQAIGLNGLDDLIKEYTNEISTENKVVQMIEEGIGEAPVEPEKPKEWEATQENLVKLELANQSVGELESILKMYRDFKITKTRLETNLISRKPLKEPSTEVDEDTFEGVSLDEMIAKFTLDKQHSEKVTDGIARLGKLSTLYIKDHSFEIDQLSKVVDDDALYKSYEEYDNYERDRLLWVSFETYSDELIQLAKQIIHELPIVNQLAKLRESTSVECPSCAHEFHLEHEKMSELESQLTGVITEENLKNTQYLRNTDIDYYLQKREAYQEFRNKPIVTLPSTPRPKARHVLSAELTDLMATQRRNSETIEELNSLQKFLADNRDFVPKYTSFDIEMKKKYLERAEYNKNLQLAWDSWNKLNEETQEKLKSYETVDEDIEQLEVIVQVLRDYEKSTVEYNIRKGLYDKAFEELTIRKEQITLLKNIRTGLQAIKPKVKTYLIPSLSKVAGVLLSQMTNNVRNKIDISDDFDIKVDGDPIDTLSGSGKSVANLAIRLGLGTVLTNRVFSVLLLDEIDSFMDSDRGASTHECLKGLKSTFKQIIMISHKDLEADNYIKL